MKKSERIQVLVDLHSEHEKTALKALGRCQQQCIELDKQLQSLRVYRQEYVKKYDAGGNQTVSVSRLLEFRAFIDKLDKAIELQQQAVDDKNRELKGVRKNWEQKHQKTQSLQKITDQAVSDEIKQIDRQEQAAQDERASRFGRKNGMESA